MALKLVLASLVGLALILLPEPTTTAAGTVMGMSILAGIFGVSSGAI